MRPCVLPLLPVLLLVGCAEVAAVLEPSPPLEADADAIEWIKSDLSGQGLTLATATEAQLKAAIGRYYPLPIESAQYRPATEAQPESVVYVVAPLTGPAVDKIMEGMGSGLPEAIGGGIAALLSLIYAAKLKVQLVKEHKAKKAQTATVTTSEPATVVLAAPTS